MKRLSLLVACAFVGISLVGCSMSEDRSAASQLGAAFYESIKAEDVNSVISFMSPEFFEVTSEDDLKILFPALKDRMGTMESYELTGWYVNKRFGTDSLSGTLVTLQYKVVYSKSPCNETLLLYKPSDGNDFKILSYNFEPENEDQDSRI